MRRFTLLLVSAFIFAGVVVPSVSAASQLAEKSACEGAGGVYTGGGCRTPGKPQTVENTVRKIVNALALLVGAVAVIMIIISGIKFVASRGDQSAVTNAKNTLLYSVVGLVITFSAYAIVNFVIFRL